MKFIPLWLTSLGVIALDQISKTLVLARFEHMERMNVLPHFFDLTLVFNPGAAFSFLAQHSGWQKYFFIVLAVMICAWLIWAIVKNQFGTLGKWAAAMIIGGAMGNVIDRLLYGQVVDFLLFYWKNWHYPAFNVADSFICVGAALLMWDNIQSSRKAEQ